MCGIAGSFGRHAAYKPSKTQVLRMADRLRHRGPDAGGSFIEAPVALACRRLRIVDVGGADQPLFNEERTVAVVFNGEIYNFVALRRGLSQRGHRFATDGDTECLVHLYEEYGIDGCLQRLVGMFSFALYDRRARRLFLARDRVGVKPLYIAETTDAWHFASEAKALLEIPAIDRGIDTTALCDALVFGYVPAPRSIFRGIRKLPAGSYAVLNVDKPMEVHRYWDLSFIPGRTQEIGELTEELAVSLQTAVQRRLVADVPLGTFLSSGLDSSVVAALMAEPLGEPPLALTVGFGEPSFDERDGARFTARLLKLNHVELEVAPDAKTVLPALARTFDEPFFDSSALPTYLLCGAARQHVSVALSGDGGDESFAGYRRYAFDVFENSVRRFVPPLVGPPVLRFLSAVAPQGSWLPQPLRGKTLLGNLARSPLAAYLHSVARMSPDRALALLSPDLRASLREYSAVDAMQAIYDRAPAEDSLSRIQYLDFHTWLPDDILCKVDRTSMAHSLEVREPLLDHELLELVARMPWDLKLRGRERKFILKETARRWLPDDLIQRPKRGFELPLRRWLQNELRNEVDAAANCPLLDGARVRSALALHGGGRQDRSSELWSAIMLSHWFEAYGQ